MMFLTEEAQSQTRKLGQTGEPQRKRKPRSAIGFFKLLASYRGSQFVFRPFGTFYLTPMQVCNPLEIRQAHSQFPPHSTAPLKKTRW